MGNKPIWVVLNILTVLMFWTVAARESRRSVASKVRV